MKIHRKHIGQMIVVHNLKGFLLKVCTPKLSNLNLFHKGLIVIFNIYSYQTIKMAIKHENDIRSAKSNN